MPFAVSAKNEMLDSLTLDAIRLHSGDPGASGTANALGAGITACTFGAAAASARASTTDADVTGLSPSQSVTWFSVWTTAGAVFKGSGQITTGDVTANVAGEYTLAIGTSVAINDV